MLTPFYAKGLKMLVPRQIEISYVFLQSKASYYIIWGCFKIQQVIFVFRLRLIKMFNYIVFSSYLRKYQVNNKNFITCKNNS